jgi:hypothetical protein
MNQFKECIDDCDHVNLGSSGPLFTWTNKHEDDDLVQVCLDRAVANGAFLAVFDDCAVENIITTTLDNFAMLIHL